MSANSPLPEVYFPKPGESIEPMLKALDNAMDKTDEEIKKDREQIDKGRVYQPKKGKQKKEEVKQEER